MAYDLKPGGSYRMPLSFGEVPGARNVPGHVAIDHDRFPDVTRFSVRFRTDPALLEAQLAPGLELAGEPIATLYFATMKNIQWLAGRSYNVLSYSFPCRFKGQRDDVTAQFKAVLWEGLPDPVVSGREDLGFPKLWCELPDPRFLDGRHNFEANWQGFRLFEAEFTEGEDVASLPPVPGEAECSGTICHKYVPRSGARGQADIDQLIYWPQFEAKNVARVNLGTGQFRFNRARWEDLPTMHHVVNALADMPVEVVRADMVWASGQGAVSNLVILE